MEDYYIQYVDDMLLQKAQKLMEDGADKVDLSGDRMNFKHYRHDNDFVVSGQQEMYRSSLQAAYWRKDYFLSLCEPGWTAWDFEIKGGRKAMNDGRLIYGVNRSCIQYINVMRKGAWHARFDF